MAALVGLAATALGTTTAGAATPAPDLRVPAVSSGAAAKAPGESFRSTITVVNRGSRRARASHARWYLSRNRVLSGGDIGVGAALVKALAPGARGRARGRLTLPEAMVPGRYHLIACADVRRAVRESREANNCATAERVFRVVGPDPTAAPAPAPRTEPAAPPIWAAAETAAIRPGNRIYMSGGAFGQCTSNFVFTDGHHNVYLGMAAHCTSTGGEVDSGCGGASLRNGIKVAVEGASGPGRMVYNSWLAMQETYSPGSAVCANNDLALVLLSPADAAKVNPSIPGWGGPVGLASYEDPGDRVYAFGNSDLRGGVRQLGPKQGVVLSRAGTHPSPFAEDSRGWSTTVYTAPGGIPGDSGSPYLDQNGNAAGLMSTWNMYTGWNGISDLPRMLEFAQAQAGLPGLVLVEGTEPFDPNLTQAITDKP